ncbi:septum formation family protein [Amycolatopsis albispora]|uniref:septum formation family protein n=1 Tax=Amycolatopsis albispora TaxID=1804986 RepID=UPI000DE5380C|nr:septum formation family protein [Amycolatopsis albispora]
MPAESERFRSRNERVRTWLLMAGVSLGAIIALSLSVLFSWGNDDITGGGGGGRSEAEKAAREAFHSPPGTCLTWELPDAADARKVGCEQPHLFEVIGVVDVAPQYPPGVPSPDLAQWRQLGQERCAETAESYLKKPLDPVGKLSIGVLHPSEPEWAEGDRQLRCGLQWASPGGQLQKLTGSAVDEDQSNVWQVGTCLALTGKTVGDPIDCAQPHAYEIIGLLDLADKFDGDEVPSEDDQKTWLDTECSKIAEEYTGGTDLTEKKLILTWDLREAESWEAGSTKVNCKVGAKLEDGSGLAPVTGSLHSDGQAPKTSTATPEPPPTSAVPADPNAGNEPPSDNHEQVPPSGVESPVPPEQPQPPPGT